MAEQNIKAEILFDHYLSHNCVLCWVKKQREKHKWMKLIFFISVHLNTRKAKPPSVGGHFESNTKHLRRFSLTVSTVIRIELELERKEKCCKKGKTLREQN